MRVSEICVKQIRVNQGLGVLRYNRTILRWCICKKVNVQGLKSSIKKTSTISTPFSDSTCHKKLYLIISNRNCWFKREQHSMLTAELNTIQSKGPPLHESLCPRWPKSMLIAHASSSFSCSTVITFRADFNTAETINYYVKSLSNNLSSKKIKTGVSREIIFQK